jgi:hypothetical protein
VDDVFGGNSKKKVNPAYGRLQKCSDGNRIDGLKFSSRSSIKSRENEKEHAQANLVLLG